MHSKQSSFFIINRQYAGSVQRLNHMVIPNYLKKLFANIKANHLKNLQID
jgi:hypothetical protein